MRYRKFQGSVDIVATTGLHLKNTQLQTDVQNNFQTKFVALNAKCKLQNLRLSKILLTPTVPKNVEKLT